MNLLSKTTNAVPDGLAYFVDQIPEQSDFLAEVISGLSQSPKSIPPKFFYDETGSYLFNKICETPEYYVTRTEIALLNNNGTEISALIGTASNVMEYGCGSSLKINALLSALHEPAEYLAIDISHEHLIQTAKSVAKTFPAVKVGALCADFMEIVDLPKEFGVTGKAPLLFFPGSTIGNQTPGEAGQFLGRVRNLLGANGSILIGVDLKKDKNILNRAYDDAEGFTAAFNLNLLKRMKNELKAEVDVGSFYHLAFFNEQQSRVEMHLVSKRAQTITLEGSTFEFLPDETIHTENSYKYSLKEFSKIAENNGFTVRKTWTDQNKLFSIQYLVSV